MARLLVASILNEGTVGNHGKTLVHNRRQRLFWFAEDGDLHEEIRAAAAGDGIEEIVVLWPDPSVAAPAELPGIEDRLAGHECFHREGELLTNSEAVFRALAAVGMSIARDSVHTNLQSATDSALRLIADGVPLTLKQEYLASGSGNYLLSPYQGIYPRKAREIVVVTDEDHVREYIANRWDALTAKGKNRIVVEEHHPDSASVFAEFFIGEDESELRGTGEMPYAPHCVGAITPLPFQSPELTERMMECGYGLARMVHSMGHRGYFSSDAIVTPEGQVLLTECNGRTSGSRYIYEIIVRRSLAAGTSTIGSSWRGRPGRFPGSRRPFGQCGTSTWPATKRSRRVSFSRPPSSHTWETSRTAWQRAQPTRSDPALRTGRAAVRDDELRGVLRHLASRRRAPISLWSLNPKRWRAIRSLAVIRARRVAVVLKEQTNVETGTARSLPDAVVSRALSTVVATISSDAHTWNLMYLQLLLEERGHQVTNLGPCTPVEEIIESCSAEHASLLVLSTVNGHGVIEAPSCIRAIRRVPGLAGLQVVIGGKLGVAGPLPPDQAQELLRLGYDAVFDTPDSINRLDEFLRRFENAHHHALTTRE
ncbi:cobalamin B12-binding domain-containing protein [Nonomuraea sp. NPDC050451]|uniref:cobalamin B12-binding domain-containing protein n=1 Tax=Nonomuraea sp. NPDC050451 TaxID=3364364 RepID=UPI00378F377C